MIYDFVKGILASKFSAENSYLKLKPNNNNVPLNTFENFDSFNSNIYSGNTLSIIRKINSSTFISSILGQVFFYK